MILTNKGSFSLYISLLVLLFIFSSCEDPGSVGSEYVDSPDLQYDTLSINSTQILSYAGYSGRLSYLPMGAYTDGIFGELTAKAMLKPIVNPVIPDSIALGNFTMQLEISLDSLETYGDTQGSADFTLYEITQPWRGRALRINDDIQYDLNNPVGSFSIGPGDSSATVENLSNAWVSEYKYYYDLQKDSARIDSSYNYEFGGLIAIPDQGSSKIEFSQVGSGVTNFSIINEAGTDTFSVPLRDWGYILERGPQNLPQSTFALHSTLEGMSTITLPFEALKNGTSTRNILRADLIFYEAEEDLTASLPSNHQRLRMRGVTLGPVITEDPAYEYQFGNLVYVGTINSESASYEINITNYINNVLFGGETRDELVLNIGNSTGVLRSTILYDETAPEQLRPKIIITSLVD